MPSSLKKSGRLQRRFFAAPTRPPGSAHTSPHCRPSLTQGAPVRLGRPHRGPNTPSRACRRRGKIGPVLPLFPPLGPKPSSLLATSAPR